jgi:DNA-directed RNA polymerase subunit RPC12/RpoP
MTKQEMIICVDCWAEVIKRSVNHTRCMDCTYKRHQEKIQELYKLDIRNEALLDSMRENEKEIW